MSSAAGKVPAPAQTVYSASKFALNGYFHSLRSEVLVVITPNPKPSKYFFYICQSFLSIS